MSGWSLKTLLAGLHGEISLRLERSRAAIGHPVAKGDATEGIWIELLKNYLPERYRVDRAFVIDSTDTTSQQIDIVVYDRQYTPLIFKQDGTLVILAESVYAVFETKRSIDAGQVEYAAKKIACALCIAPTYPYRLRPVCNLQNRPSTHWRTSDIRKRVESADGRSLAEGAGDS
ncbi:MULTISPECIES: DUF6602 domain-containing protein [unclassified Bradyrhizobium]|nr:hypothetical protein [Bradyrhizobium sp. USDA 4541]